MSSSFRYDSNILVLQVMICLVPVRRIVRGLRARIRPLEVRRRCSLDMRRLGCQGRDRGSRVIRLIILVLVLVLGKAEVEVEGMMLVISTDEMSGFSPRQRGVREMDI